jgi:hypothetical protein
LVVAVALVNPHQEIHLDLQVILEVLAAAADKQMQLYLQAAPDQVIQA